MATASQSGYLLDTNILVHWIRGKSLGKAIAANSTTSAIGSGGL